MKVRLLVLGSLLTLLTGCSSAEDPGGPAPSQLTQDVRPAAPSESTTDSPAAAPLMPDLVGMPSAKAGERLGELGLGSTWGRPVVVRCQARPRTVVRQRPAAGTTLTPDTTVHVRTAAMDLDRFRGPCEPLDKLVGPVAEADLELAREFYRFAADPSLGSAFADGGVWVGIEDGLKSTRLVGSELGELGHGSSTPATPSGPARSRLSTRWPSVGATTRSATVSLERVPPVTTRLHLNWTGSERSASPHLMTSHRHAWSGGV